MAWYTATPWSLFESNLMVVTVGTWAGKKLRCAATAHEAIQSGCARTMYLAVAGQLGLFTRFCGREDVGDTHLA